MSSICNSNGASIWLLWIIELNPIYVYQVIRFRGSRSDEAENITNSTLLLSNQQLIHQHESTRNNLNLREQSIISLEGIRLRETTSGNANRWL